MAVNCDVLVFGLSPKGGHLLESAERAVLTVSAATLLLRLGRADRLIDSALDASGLEDKAFDAGKKVDAIQQGVEPVRDGTVAAVFGVGVMGGMAARALQDFCFLEKSDHLAVLARGAMGPAVNFVRDGSDDGSKNPGPVEPTHERDEEKQTSRDDAGGQISFPEVGLGKVTRLVVVADVGFDDPFAKQGPLLVSVRVFQPMDKAGGKIDRKNNAHCL